MKRKDIMNQQSARILILHAMWKPALLIVFMLSILTLAGCAIRPVTMICHDKWVTLVPGECRPFIVSGMELPADSNNLLCHPEYESFGPNWFLSPIWPPPPGLYYKTTGQGSPEDTTKALCASPDIPKYADPVNVTYHTEGTRYEPSPFGSRTIYVGIADFIFTSPGSGPLRVDASAESDTIPFGSSTRLLAYTGGGTGPEMYYSWLPADSLDDGDAQNPYASPSLTTTYEVSVTDSAGDVVSDSVTVTVTLAASVSAVPAEIYSGEPAHLNVLAGGGTPPYAYTYAKDDGAVLASNIPDSSYTVHPAETTTYVVTVTDAAGATYADSVQVQVIPPAELQIIQVPSVYTLRAGEAFYYEFIVTNRGQSPALYTFLEDLLPAGVSYIPPLPLDCDRSASGFICQLGELAPGERTSITIHFQTDPAAAGELVNTVYVGSYKTDLVQSASSVNVCPAGTASCFDLEVYKTGDLAAAVGDSVSYELEVNNLGPDEVNLVTVTDILPPGFVFKPAGSSPECSASGQTVTCNLGYFYPGLDTRIVALEATVTVEATAGRHVNTATVFSALAQDPIPYNNSDSTETDVVQVMTLDVTADPALLNLGESSQLMAAVSGGIPPYSFQWAAHPESGNPSDGGITPGDETLQNPLVTPLSATEYTVIVTDADGRAIAGSVAVIVQVPGGLQACFNVTPDPPDRFGEIEIWDARCSTGNITGYRWVFWVPAWPGIYDICYGGDSWIDWSVPYAYDSSCADFTYNSDLVLLPHSLEGPPGLTWQVDLYVTDGTDVDSVSHTYAP